MFERRPGGPRLRPPPYGGLGVLCLLATLALPVDSAAQTVTVRVSQSSDDAEEDLSDNSMYLGSSDLEIDLDDWDFVGPQYVGMRFQNITVPVGATITSAKIQFHVDETHANVPVTITFTGQDIDDAPTFASSGSNLSNRTETSSSVVWAIPHWSSVSDEGASQLSADLSNIVQEIVDRAGWASGNDIVILIRTQSGSGYRTAESYDGESASAPEISITYSQDSTPPSAPVVTQPTSPTIDSTPTISGTASEDGGTITLTSDLDGLLAPTGSVSGGTWSIDLATTLSVGNHAITAVHKDAAGNESAASGSKSLEIKGSVTSQVRQSSDDAEERQSDGTVNLTSTDLEVDLDDVGNSGPQYVGMRFQNITIPAGATIDEAYVQFHVDEIEANVAVTTTFTGEDIDDAPAFTTGTNNISNRTETAASVDWAIPHWVAVHDEGSDQRSADLSTIVQEIVDRSGWASGNDIVILIKTKSGSGYRTAEAFNGEAASGPTITIGYTPDTTAPTAPGITQPPSPTGDTTPVLSGTASEDGGTITLTSSVEGVLAPTGTVSGGTWSIELTTELSNGTHALTATHTDASSNESAASSGKTLIVDLPPTPAISTVGGSPLNDDPVQFAVNFGEAIDTSTFALADIAASSGTKQNLVNTGDDQNWTFEVASPTDGATLTVNIPADVLTDTNANNNLVSNTLNLAIDRTAPTVPIITQPTTPTNDTTPVITGTGSEDGGTITLTSDVEGVLAPTTTVSGGAWSITLTTTLSLATHSLTATHTDTAGNVSSASGAKSIAILENQTDDFRSAASGNWTTDSNWERWNGSAWVSAPNDPTSSDGQITVRSPHTMTVNSDRTVDELVIESGATVAVTDGRLRITDGSGTDLVVSGTIEVDGDNFEIRSSSTAIFTSSAVVEIDDGRFGCQHTATCTFQSGAVVNLNSDKFRVEDTATAIFETGSTLNNNDEIELRDDATLQISGTVVHTAVLDIQDSTVQLQILSGGVWNQAKNGSSLPDLDETTWNANSTLLITGVTSSLPSNFTDSYGHITWNATGQTSALNLAASPTAVAGNLTVQSTGSSTLRWGSGDDLSLGGDYLQTGGTFIFSNAGGTLSATDVSVTGGTLTLTNGGTIPTLDVDGDFIVNGGAINETGATSGSIKFTGSSTQSVTAASGLSGDIDLYVENTGGIQLLDDLLVPRHLTGTTGTIDLNSNDLSLSGSLTIDSDLTNAATITFTGASTRNITYAPGTLSIPTLVVDKSSAVLALATDLTITTTASVRNGTLDTNGRTLTFGHGTTLYNAGTVSGNVTFQRTYSQTSDGWRMLATPVDGINYSGLNTSFHTQGATWADFGSGTATLQSADFGAQDWTPLSGADASFAANDGYIFYMFDEAKWVTQFPATWTVAGSVRATASRSLSWNTVSTDSYNLAGNRTTSNLDWNAVVSASTNVATTYSTWDPALTTGGGLTGYKYYNSASGLGDAGRYIPPFTAFMVEPSASGGSLSFPTSEAANLQSANYFGKRESESASTHLRLTVEGQGLAEVETYLSFDAGAIDGQDDHDAHRMRPIAQEFVTLISLQGGRKLAFDGRSMSGGIQDYQIAVAASAEGVYDLAWPSLLELPAHWQVMLEDLVDYRVIDLRKQASLRFLVSDANRVDAAKLLKGTLKPRFRIVIVDPNLAEVPELGVVPGQVALQQNYPNPFNPTTSIRYSLPEFMPVRLEVFDTLGRRVQQLVNASQDAGWHEVRWNASRQPSGPYFYRLTTGNTSLIRPMILLR